MERKREYQPHDEMHGHAVPAAMPANIRKSVDLSDPRYYDITTNLPNMSYLIACGDGIAFKMMESGDRPCAVYFNLRGMKNYNSAYGFEAGSDLLRAISQIISAEFEGLLVCRMSDDHFAVLAPAKNIANRIARVQQEAAGASRGLTIALLAGSYEIDAEVTEISAAFDRAKLACDSIQNVIDKRYAPYVAEMGIRAKLHDYVSENIDTALENEWVVIYYQPVVRTLSGEVCGLEALARWDDPERGILNPGTFIEALEATHQIHKLDTYVIDKVCRTIKYGIDHGLHTVPVSLNLSRLDFFTCDIFKVVEDTVMKHGVPRDLLNIEVTESVMIESRTIADILDKFQDAGYQVWMDDFGSGYSSLNALKDCRFDQLKIDMIFLSSLNERSRAIITSVVQMAKRLGISTLAEGVENREQLEFLRSIGCEKLQGYLIGKPQPLGEATYALLDRGIKPETREWRHFWDQVGKVDVITQAPLSLFIEDGDYIRFLFANAGYREAIASVGTRSLKEAEANINLPQSPMSLMFHKFAQRVAQSAGEETIIYADGDSFMKLTAELIASHGNKRAYRASLTNTSADENELKRQGAIDAYIREIALLYETIYVLHLDDDYAEPVLTSGTFGEFGKKRAEDLLDQRNMFASTDIYSEDEHRYLAFADPRDMTERLESAPDGFIAEQFRTLDRETGNYDWKAHVIMMVPKTQGRVVLQMMHAAAKAPVQIARSLPNTSATVPIGDAAISYDELWTNLVNESNLRYFWKDAQCRFAGASRAFLDFCGIDSIDDLVGKTDADMGWSITTGLEDADYAVLREGKRFVDLPVKRIFAGVVHNIFITKIPIYQDGQIIGILGYFVDSQRIIARDESILRIQTTDPATGLMSGQGLLECLWQFHDAYALHGLDYAFVMAKVPEFRRIERTYGMHIVGSLLQEITGKLRESCGSDCAIGRIAGCTFGIIKTVNNDKEATDLVATVQRAVASVHEIDGNSCTVHAHTCVARGSQPKTTEQIIASALTEQDL